MKATVVVLLSLALLLWASATAGAQATPYEGVVTGSSVYVRSGPNMGSYPVAKLSAPDRVTVVQALSDDWLAIQPVRGCYGVISAQYVQPDATGRIGTILGDGVLVRAAGELRTRDFDNPLGKRNRGDRVRIIGRVVGADGKAEWYVIKPPADMRFYISSQFIQPANEAAPPSREREEEGEETSVAPETPAETPETPETPEAPSERAAVGAPVRQELDALRAIRELEKDVVAESAKPLERRNFSTILVRAENINLPKDSRFYPIYDSLMQYLREEASLVESTRATEKMVDDVLRKAAEKSGAVAQPYVPAPPKEPKVDQLEGVLTVSALYTIADPSKPSRYVIRDPQTQAVIGYVQSADGKVRLKDFEGKYVRVQGRHVYDDSISMKILDVDTLTPMSPPPIPVKLEPAVEKPVAPVKAPEPVEPAEPVVEQPAAPVKAPEPVKPAEPVMEKPAAPVVEEPTTPVKAPEPVKPAEPVVEEPVEPAMEEPITPVKTPEPVMEEEPMEPKPVVKKTIPPEPADLEPAEPAKTPEPATPKPITPAKVEPSKIQPMEIYPADVEPTDVDAPDLPAKPAKAAPAKSPEPKPIPADQPPEPEMKMFEVEPTEGDVEVEWD